MNSVVPVFAPSAEDRALLSSIYKVGNTLNDWNRLLDQFCESGRMRSFHIGISNAETKVMRFHIGGGKPFLQEYIQAYINHYSQYDLCQHYAIARADQKFHATSLIEDISMEAHGSFYTQWCQPQGILHGAACCMFNNGPWQATLQANRGPEHAPFSEQDITRLNHFVPAFANSLSRTLMQYQTDNREFHEAALNCFRLPVALFDPFGSLVAMNADFKRHLGSDSVLNVSDNVLSLSDPDLEIELRVQQLACLHRDIGYQYSLDDPLIEGKALKGIRIGFTALSSQTNESTQKSMGGIVYLLDSNLLRAPSVDQLMSLFPLTPRESELCRNLLKGYSPKIIARTMNLSTYTVREYLSSVFQKTGTHNQLQLVNLLASIPLQA